MWSLGFASVVELSGCSSTEVSGVADDAPVEEVGCAAAGVVCGNSVGDGVCGTSPEDVSATFAEDAVASSRAVVVVAGVEERAGAVVVGAGV